MKIPEALEAPALQLAFAALTFLLTASFTFGVVALDSILFGRVWIGAGRCERH